MPWFCLWGIDYEEPKKRIIKVTKESKYKKGV